MFSSDCLVAYALPRETRPKCLARALLTLGDVHENPNRHRFPHGSLPHPKTGRIHHGANADNDSSRNYRLGLCPLCYRLRPGVSALDWVDSRIGQLS